MSLFPKKKVEYPFKLSLLHIPYIEEGYCYAENNLAAFPFAPGLSVFPWQHATVAHAINHMAVGVWVFFNAWSICSGGAGAMCLSERVCMCVLYVGQYDLFLS